jgi:hypothetical protein
MLGRRPVTRRPKAAVRGPGLDSRSGGELRGRPHETGEPPPLHDASPLSTSGCWEDRGLALRRRQHECRAVAPASAAPPILDHMFSICSVSGMPAPRRFPAPWQVHEATESFCIRDASGQALAYIYFEDEKGRRDVMKRLTRDEARRIAANVAKLPEMLRRPQ